MLKNVIFTYFATAKVVLSYCTELLSILIINSQSDSVQLYILHEVQSQFWLKYKLNMRYSLFDNRNPTFEEHLRMWFLIRWKAYFLSYG